MVNDGKLFKAAIKEEVLELGLKLGPGLGLGLGLKLRPGLGLGLESDDLEVV